MSAGFARGVLHTDLRSAAPSSEKKQPFIFSNEACFTPAYVVRGWIQVVSGSGETHVNAACKKMSLCVSTCDLIIKHSCK